MLTTWFLAYKIQKGIRIATTTCTENIPINSDSICIPIYLSLSPIIPSNYND
jgi:hypothetical protein